MADQQDFFLRFSSGASRVSLVHMMKKVLFYSFLSVFYHFQPCERVRKHAFAGPNTQFTGHVTVGLAKV